jgi:hypothetical protein
MQARMTISAPVGEGYLVFIVGYTDKQIPDISSPKTGTIYGTLTRWEKGKGEWWNCAVITEDGDKIHLRAALDTGIYINSSYIVEFDTVA